MTAREAKRIILVSDGTGETAAQMTQAAMVQFGNPDALFTRFKNVRNESQIEAICETAAASKDLVIYTIVSPQLRNFLVSRARELSIPLVDLLGPLLVGLGNYFGYEPKAVAGLLHDVNDRYFERIAAMEYTVAHDDGRDFSDLDKADLVIIGISRTSKTPLSMYLSHQGWKVANIPLIQGFDVPKEVYAIDQRRIVCLTIDPSSLTTIRRARLERLGHERGGDYADPDKVHEEVEFAAELYRRNRRWPVFDVSGKALEETASEIIRLMASRRLAPSSALEHIPPGTR
jgi:regulator of PEP synthase PpsR (kinase-PPPase family)